AAVGLQQRSLRGFRRDWRASRRLCHAPERRARSLPDRSERSSPQRAQSHSGRAVLQFCRFSVGGGAGARGIEDAAVAGPYHLSWDMVLRLLAALLVFSTTSFAGISDDVRAALAQNNFSAAEAELQNYRGQQGATPDYVEALSW